MLFSKSYPSHIQDLAKLNFNNNLRYIHQGRMPFTYIDSKIDIKKDVWIDFNYSDNKKDKIFRYYCYNLPGCIIEENDPEEAYNKFIWGVSECLDCRFKLQQTDKQIYLTGHVYTIKDYSTDISNENTMEVNQLETKLKNEGYNLIYTGVTINIFYKKGFYSTLCIPNTRLKPIMSLNMYYDFIRLTAEISGAQFFKMYGY